MALRGVGSVNRQKETKKVKYQRVVSGLILFLMLCLPTCSVVAAPSGDQIVDMVIDRFQDITGLGARIELSYWNENGRKNNMGSMMFDLIVDVQSACARAVFLKGLYEGQIIIFDYKSGLVYDYRPVLDVVYYGPPEKIAPRFDFDFGVLNPAQLLSLDKSNITSAKYLKTESLERIEHYVIEVRTKESPTTYQHIWVDSETHLLSKAVSYYASGNIQAQVTITNYQPNLRLNPAAILRTPIGAKLVKL